MRILIAWILVFLLAAGCSRDTRHDTPSSPDAADPAAESSAAEMAESAADAITTSEQQTAAHPSPLSPEAWLVTDGGRSLDDPILERQADFVAIDEGLQFTSSPTGGRVDLVLRQELLNDFEITARIVQPSVDELREEGLARPSPFAVRFGFRTSDGNPSVHLAVPRKRDVRATSDVMLRASDRYLFFVIDGGSPRIMPRPVIEPGHFCLAVSSRSRVVITELEIREGLDPDPELAAMAEQRSSAALPPIAMAMPPGGWGPMPNMGPGGYGMGPPGGPPPDGWGPMPNMGPGGYGMGPPGGPPPGGGGMGPAGFGGGPPAEGGMLAAPSRREPLMSQGGRTVPKLEDSSLDTATPRDVPEQPALQQSAPQQSPALPSATRVWTDASGRYRMEGTFVAIEKDRVRFRRKDGTEISVSLADLSPDDQQLIEKLAAP